MLKENVKNIIKSDIKNDIITYIMYNKKRSETIKNV